MDDILKELSLHRLSRAREVREEAELLFSEGHYCSANNRCYYSVYYAMKSIMALESKDFKRHKDVVAYFNQNYVKTEMFSRDLGRKISKLQMIREKSDYSDFYFATKEEAESQMDAADDMLEQTERYLKGKGIL